MTSIEKRSAGVKTDASVTHPNTTIAQLRCGIRVMYIAVLKKYKSELWVSSR